MQSDITENYPKKRYIGEMARESITGKLVSNTPSRWRNQVVDDRRKNPLLRFLMVLTAMVCFVSFFVALFLLIRPDYFVALKSSLKDTRSLVQKIKAPDKEQL